MWDADLDVMWGGLGVCCGRELRCGVLSLMGEGLAVCYGRELRCGMLCLMYCGMGLESAMED